MSFRYNGTNRRRFLKAMGAASLFGRKRGEAAGILDDSSPLYAYVSSEERHSIEAFQINGSRWAHMQRIPCQAPACIVTHPHRRTLYVANAVALHEGLPQGTTEVFSVNGQNGTLSSIQRQPLSLSGTEPRNLWISPDGLYFVVVNYGGGSYNVLPIEQNGSLGPVRHIFKELGCGFHTRLQASAHPHTIIPDSSGRFLLASDFGCNQLTVFGLSDTGELQRHSKVTPAAGAGPGSMKMHPDGSALYVRHELTPSIAVHRYRPSDGVIEDAFQTVALPEDREYNISSRSGLIVDPKGKFLYAASANGLTAWAIDPDSSALSLAYSGEEADALFAGPNAASLYAIDQRRGVISQLTPDVTSGKWDSAVVAAVPAPTSLLFLRC